MDDRAKTMLDAAVEFATKGWKVGPLNGKIPITEHGVKDFTNDLELVFDWWSTTARGANIGARVPDGTFVVDVDPRNGAADSMRALLDEHGPLPDTLQSVSGRGDGGSHRFYLAPAGRKLTSKHLGAGIDIKTSAGYVVVPPSIHPETKLPYVWWADTDFAEPPAWLLDLIVVIPPLPQQPRTPRTAFMGDSIADAFTESVTWADVLGEHGWTALDGDGERDGARWLHPAATSACSATVKHGLLFVYSPNTPFELTEAGDPHGYTKFRAYAVLNHSGDLSEAARQLRKTGEIRHAS